MLALQKWMLTLHQMKLVTMWLFPCRFSIRLPIFHRWRNRVNSRNWTKTSSSIWILLGVLGLQSSWSYHFRWLPEIKWTILNNVVLTFLNVVLGKWFCNLIRNKIKGDVPDVYLDAISFVKNVPIFEEYQNWQIKRN